MRLLTMVLSVTTALVGVVLGGALMLSPDYAVSRSVVIQAPAGAIYQHLDSSPGWARWGVWYRNDPQMKVTNSGPAKGAGAAWSWLSASQGNGKMKLTAVEPERKVAYELQIESFAPSAGALTLEPAEGGTRVTWSMEGRMDNLISRWLAFFMDRMVGPDFEAGLANLKQLSENP
ncbi:SRPBCC family protein [Inhella gelatinilytica]|uniref:SRPBCC family protein n=1 Tax=Inhella gelatinilytica TaxID=2795030 RepID=A0A931NC69_9BURK|nr:SRPBCC family protein [Inhella gelatinilytica]MBH9551254.1 SRPBCC family protein [Inhella gelatinilytica]